MTLQDIPVLYGETMNKYISMRVGGPAGAYYLPEDEDSLIACIRSAIASDKPYFLLGNGTNVIVRDGGYPGAVISTLKALSGIEVPVCEYSDEKLVHKACNSTQDEASCRNGSARLFCGAGEPLAKACRFAAEQSLSGLEKLAGIPGTVGGAVFMNAGAYGGEISDVLANVKAYDPDFDKIIMLTKDECGFSYRSSIFKTKPIVILSAELELQRGERQEIETEMAEYTRKRNEKQPVDLPSAGSFFKRPEGDYAGRLIEEAGLKGVRVGGAQVSEKHAGFIVNTGGATAADVLELTETVKAKVYQKFRIKLEEEPIVIGI